MGPDWVRENDRRQAYLNRLYELDNRSDCAHPLHGTYTALIANRSAYLLQCDREQVLPDTGFQPAP